MLVERMMQADTEFEPSACTGVPVEISHNSEPCIEADISFISSDEWLSELTNLVKDIIEQRDDPSNKEEANTALKKVAWILFMTSCVMLTAPRFATCIPRCLSSSCTQWIPTIYSKAIKVLTFLCCVISAHRDIGIFKCLGSVVHISELDSVSFGRELQRYIDSNYQELDSEGNAITEDRSILCPLIRLVQIRCNAEVLATGCTLVDLPGVADSNNARAAIAKDYMKKCNFFWIVAPIIRLRFGLFTGF